jgi:hypothetical protein
MSHQSLKLIPGVDQNETLALNEAGISISNLIRFIFDRRVGGLIQKLGGWTRFYENPTVAIVRALWGWADTNAVNHLAFGTENIGTTGHAQLSVITNGVRQNITPTGDVDNITPVVSTTAGSPIVTITDTTITGITFYDSVYIETHIAVGGLILFGLYPCLQVDATHYQITATDRLGNPLPAPSSSTAPVVAEFTTTVSQSTVQVTLPAHGYIVGDTYPILIDTSVGGIDLFGNYLVAEVIDANNFIIIGQGLASSSASAFINGGLARYTYSYGYSVLPGGGGYGVGGYGVGGYGAGSGVPPATGFAIAADDWTLDNWGEVLVIVPISSADFRPIYIWDPLAGSVQAACLSAGPPVNDGAFVAMPQRQIVAWGTTVTGVQDPLLIRWCDVNNYDVWIGKPTNQAGQYRIPRGSKIVGGLQGPQQGFIWTDLAIWAMQYIGPPYVYSFNEIGAGCGLIARKAAGVLNGVVYWMGASQFYQLEGGGVAVLDCPIWDVIFQDLDRSNLQKIRFAANSRFNEIAWYYPTISSGGEVTNYVKYNIHLQTWDYGILGRTAWIDQSVLGPPIGADPATKYIYQHETSENADGQPLMASFRTGYFAMAEGDLQTTLDEVWPDMKWGEYGGTQNATLFFKFYFCDYPGDTPQVDGPYSVTQLSQYFSPRLRARLVSIEIYSTDMDSFWRIGLVRYRSQQDGRY